MRKTANNLKFLFFPSGIIVMLILATIFMKARVRAAEVTPTVTCKWGVVSSPNAGLTSVLSRGAALSSTDVWAVGSGSDNSGVSLTLTENWNGSTWTVVTSPNVGTSGSSLSGVTAISPSDVWAVGSGSDNSGVSLTLTENWNGSAWTVVTSPNVGTSGSSLAGITAISTNNIWAVGSYFDKSQMMDQTLIEHWNGTQWSIVASPNVSGTYNFLTDIQTVSAKNIWAVGYTGAPVFGVRHQALIEHWNGTKWKVISSPQFFSGDLQSISAVSGKNIWAVGGYLPSSSSSKYQTLTEHWNGTQWSIVASADIAGNNDYLAGISAISASNIWAVGASQTGNYQSSKTLIEHWNGSKWTISTSSNPDPNNNFLLGTMRVPSTTSVWSIGNTGNGSPTQTLTEFRC